MKIKEAFIFVDRSVDSAKHRATIETSKFELLIQGVNNVEEGVSVAKQLVEQGVSAVDLCPGFGYTGVKAVSDAVGDKVPVGMVTHQLQDAPKLAKALEAWEQSEPHAGHGCMGDPVER